MKCLFSMYNIYIIMYHLFLVLWVTQTTVVEGCVVELVFFAGLGTE